MSRATLVLALCLAQGCALVMGRHYTASGDSKRFSSIVANGKYCYTTEHGITVNRDADLAECPPQRSIETLTATFLRQYRVPPRYLYGTYITFTPHAIYGCGSYHTGEALGCVNYRTIAVQLQGYAVAQTGWGNVLCMELGHVIDGPVYRIRHQWMSDKQGAAAEKVDRKRIAKAEARVHGPTGKYRFGCLSEKTALNPWPSTNVADPGGGTWP